MTGLPVRNGAGPPAVPVAAITGWSTHIVDPLPASVRDLQPETACTADDAREVLGRKGLLYKDAATRLALCAVHRALDRPPRAPRPSGPPDPRTAVVASSNLGSTATVLSIMATVAAGSGRDVSPLAAPNASSNVVASSVALWFRFGGPNLMVCSGATSGLDAVSAGVRLLRAGRADRVVVVGVEPGDEAARSVHRAAPDGVAGHALLEGAACLVLEPVTALQAGTPALEAVRAASGGPPDAAEDAALTAVFGPWHRQRPPCRRCVGPEELGGDGYGAAGVLYTALAARLLVGGPEAAATAVCGDDTDGWRSTRIRVSGGAYA